MVEGIHCPVECLVEQQVVQILRTAFEPYLRKPQRTACAYDAPCSPAPVTTESLQLPPDNQKGKRRQQRNEDADRSLGEECQQDTKRKEQPVCRRIACSRIHAPEKVKRQRNEQTHEHIHAQKYRQSEKQPAGHQHQCCRCTPPFVQCGTYPAIHRKENSQCRKKREQ